MERFILDTPLECGTRIAAVVAEALQNAIEEKGYARFVGATGASQFELIEALSNKDIDWSKVELFHLDEYVGLPITHPASFAKYIKERFVKDKKFKEVHYIDGTANTKKTLDFLNKKMAEAPIDVVLIGIGENGHIAFNDPPANFDTEESYIVVDLDEKCKAQQVREGWFPDNYTVPQKAITMTVSQIMKSKLIASCVPHKAKAEAVRSTFANDNEVTNMVPATVLKTHPNWVICLDKEAASLL